MRKINSSDIFLLIAVIGIMIFCYKFDYTGVGRIAKYGMYGYIINILFDYPKEDNFPL